MRISDWSSDVCSSDLRVFNVRSLTLNASAQASLGLGGRNESEGFVSTSRTSLDSPAHDVLGVIRARIEPFLSREGEIGRASCRERVCQYVSISGAAVALKKQQKDKRIER